MRKLSVMGKVAITCPGCQTRYKITIQGEAREKISFTCKKCSQILEVDPGLAREESPTQELLRTICEKCGSEFVKNPEDDSKSCYQCRIDLLVSKNKQEAAEAPKPAPAAAPEFDKSAARYTFKNDDGLLLGPIKLRTATVLIREKRVIGKEEVSRDGSEFKPLREYPELVEFFPELAVPAEPIPREETAPEPGSAPGPGSAPAEEISPPTLADDPLAYYLRPVQGKLFGPVKKSTVVDLIGCGFLCGKDEYSLDLRTWLCLSVDQEFKSLVPNEEAEVMDLTETVEE